jgi:DNA-binding CsgD family transcriptional regulator
MHQLTQQLQQENTPEIKKERKQDLVEHRRSEVLDLAAKGLSQSQISRILHVDRSTISRDFTTLRQQAKDNIKLYLEERLPFEYEKCLASFNTIQARAWLIVEKSEDPRVELLALQLAKDCSKERVDLLNHAQTVDDAIRFATMANKALEKEEKHDICGIEEASEQYNEVF